MDGIGCGNFRQAMIGRRCYCNWEVSGKYGGASSSEEVCKEACDAYVG